MTRIQDARHASLMWWKRHPVPGMTINFLFQWQPRKKTPKQTTMCCPGAQRPAAAHLWWRLDGAPEDIISRGHRGKRRQRGDGHIWHRAAVRGFSTWAQIGILGKRKGSHVVICVWKLNLHKCVCVWKRHHRRWWFKQKYNTFKSKQWACVMWQNYVYLVEVSSLHGWSTRTRAAPRAQPRLHLVGKTGGQKQLGEVRFLDVHLKHETHVRLCVCVCVWNHRKIDQSSV